MAKSGWIGVDLDGTLAHYDGWRGHTHIGAPIQAMVERIKKWLAEGREVRIFTARMAEPRPKIRKQVAEAIADYTKLHVGKALRATNIKDFSMIEIWDDRAVRVMLNTGETCCNTETKV